MAIQLPWGDVPVALDRFRTPPREYGILPFWFLNGELDPDEMRLQLRELRDKGMPGIILHGLWTMAQVARAQTTAGGGPGSLARLSVQFRGMGFPEREVRVTGTVADVRDGTAVVHAVAEQDGKAIIRNAEAEIAVG